MPGESDDTYPRVSPDDASSREPTRGELLRFIGIMVLFWASLYVFVPVMAPLAAQRGASMRLIGVIVGSYGLVLFLSRIPLGIWSDRRRSRAKFVGYGFVAAAAGALGMALIDNPLVMVASRGLTGVAAAMWVMVTVLFASRYSLDRIPYAMGVAITCSYFTQTVVTLSGGIIADRFGWEAPFFVAALFAVGGLGLVRTLEDTSPPAASTPVLGEIVRVATRPAVLVASLLAALVMAVQLMTVHGFTPLLATELGAGGSALGILSFAATAMMGAGSYVSGRWIVHRVGPAATVTAGFTLASAFTGSLSISASLPVLVVLQAIGALGIGVVLTPLSSLTLEAVPIQLRATAMAVFQAIYSLGIFAGPLIAGALAERHGISAAFIGASAVAACGAAVSVPAIRRAYAFAIHRPSAETS